MCGIAGYVGFSEKQTELVGRKMLTNLYSRGPDEEGLYLDEEICLAHRRLIVIDPEGGKQPMECSANGNNILVYNGELYNTEDIRKELLTLGYTFDGHSDTEVLLKSYVEWGADCTKKLNGIYAFAVWNDREKKLFLARDRMGVKPLFYSLTDDGIVFGSEIKALLCHPKVKPRVDENGLSQLFLLGPAKIPNSGVFKDIEEILPGYFAYYSKDDGFKTQPYWSLEAKEHTDTVQQTIEKTRYLIEDATHRQLVSDVPLCCFLSGGLDSSILSMIAAKEYEKQGKTLTTYSIDYKDNQKYFTTSIFQPNSDSEYIEMMVEHIKSEHKEIVLDNALLAFALNYAVDARDLPGMADIDSSLLMVCEQIKKDFSVAISGECADELFGGYPWYHNEEILFCDTFPWSRSINLRQSIIKHGIIKNGEEFVREQYLKTINSAPKLDGENIVDSRMREMFVLNLKWFMQTLLDRKDRMSMYSGVEVRVPFCDHKIAEYAYNMPWSFKALNGREKGIVRTAFSDTLPHEIVWRKKSPYPKTHNPLYLELTRSFARQVLNDKGSVVRDILNKKKLNEILEDPLSIEEPFFGQLMKAPQMFAYISQLDYWFKRYKVQII